MQTYNLIQGCMFTGERKSEGQRMLLLQTDFLLSQEILQRLCHMVKQLKDGKRKTHKEVGIGPLQHTDK